MTDYTIPVLPPIRKTEAEWKDCREPVDSGQLGIVSDKNSVFVGNGADLYSDKRIMRPINPVDNLNSTSTTETLSANQGRVLAKEHLVYELWVDQEAGSDTSGEGTSVKPYKTLQHTLDIAPKNGDLIIKLASRNDGYTYTITKPIDIYNDYFEILGVPANASVDKPIVSIPYQASIKNAGYVFNCCSKRQCKFNNIQFEMFGAYTNADYLKNTYLILADYCTSGIIIENCDIDTSANFLSISGGKAKVTKNSFSNYTLLAYEYYSDLVFSDNTYEYGANGFHCVGGQVHFRDALNLAAPNGNTVEEDAKIIGTSGTYTVNLNSTAPDGIGVGSAEVPFKKIEYAVAALPTHCTGKYTIDIKAGNYTEKPINLSNKCLGGSISLEGAGSTSTSIRVSPASVVNNTDYPGVNGVYGILCYAKGKGYVNISIMNLGIRSTSTSITQYLAIGVFCCGTAYTYLENVRSEYCETGLYFQDIVGVAYAEQCYCRYDTNTHGIIFSNCALGKSIGLTSNTTNAMLLNNYGSIVLFDKINGNNSTTPNTDSRGRTGRTTNTYVF